ncbi:MAG: hypothetical protein J6N52_09115 [Clostridia bacterium]|nr:hypothetical protein [Clostridia bacterium]
MKERIQGVVAGVLIGALCTGGAVFAKHMTENIEVTYDNIKVYKDNVLCELKDSNGSVIEPFIYNGTTYMPVRGTANLAGMDVTWDGATQSVYLWDEQSFGEVFLTDVCPPYETDWCGTSTSFKMSGETYGNGIECWGDDSVSLFNLNGKYSQLECVIGHIEYDNLEKSVTFIVDGHTVKTFVLEPESLPQKINIPLNNGLQLKIVGDANATSVSSLGIGNIIVK